MNLFDLEQKILGDIADAFPYAFSEVNRIYQKTCSFDKTIQILDICKTHDISPDIVIDLINTKLI